MTDTLSRRYWAPSDRLRELRRKFGWAEWNAIGVRPKSPKTARNVRIGPQSVDGTRFVEYASEGLRVKLAHDIFRAAGMYRAADECDWYTDGFQDNTTKAAVIYLPSRDGSPRCYPATSDPWNDDCYRVDFASEYDDEIAAARDAAGMAERFAEECHEDDTKQRAEQRIEEYAQECRELRAEHSALARELHTLAEGSASRAAIVERLHDIRREYRFNVERARELKDEPYRIDAETSRYYL